MNKKHNKRFSRVLTGLIIAAAICIGGYFAFCFWINASGTIAGSDAEVDQGSAIVIDGANRREGVFSLLICATDEEEKRTDSMMVLVFDTKNRKANILNIPRDSLVDCDRTGSGRKINAAYAYGVDEMLDEVSTVIGFRPDKYLVANFDAIAKIVDVVGGVDYDVPFDMSYHDASQDLSIEFKKGKQHLDGKQVVEYLRWRHNDDGTGYDDGDIGRVTKLQDFLVTVGDAVLRPSNILKIPDIAAAVTENVKTDLSTSQILWIGMQGMKMDMEKDVKMETLYGDSARVNFGLDIWFYILDEDMIIDQINKSFNPYTYELTEDNFDIVTPNTYGIYSEDWRQEKALRYQTYKNEKEKAEEKNEKRDSGSAAVSDDE